jgi:hypothetical protein
VTPTEEHACSGELLQQPEIEKREECNHTMHRLLLACVHFAGTGTAPHLHAANKANVLCQNFSIALEDPHPLLLDMSFIILNLPKAL